MDKKGNIPSTKKSVEQCIRCGKITDIRIDTPIEKRKYFVEGAGQMCEECWGKIFGKGMPLVEE